MNRKSLVFGMSFAFLIMGLFILPPVMELLLALVFTVCTAVSCRVSWSKRNQAYVSTIMVFPVFLSAVQNIYLGLAAPRMTSLELQILLTVNILMVFLLFIFIPGVAVPKNEIWIKGCFTAISLHTAIMYLFYPSNLPALLSSFRNIISPILFFGFSYSVRRGADDVKIERYLRRITAFVVLFGLIEYFSGNIFWKNLNIQQLWTLKGIGVTNWGVPANWYSSEKLNGHHLRRMVSSFADPVNLGTWLFGAHMLAWYKKKRILQLAVILCCIITVSKGALLGFLIFFVLYFWYMDCTKISMPLIAGTAIGITSAFWFFSITSSSGSAMFHLKGFLNSLTLPLHHPFGLGVGNIGVLASVFGNYTIYDTGVTETGIGKIIAELGITGIFIYIVFFYKLFRLPSRWECIDKRKCIYYYTLLFSIFANAAFNEVALSPNSCGIYFLLLGRIAVSGEIKSIHIFEEALEHDHH